MARLNSKDPFLAAFKATGDVSEAADAAGIHRSIHYRRLKEDPAYRKAFEQIRAEFSVERVSKSVKEAASLRQQVHILRKRLSNLEEEFRRAQTAKTTRSTASAPKPALSEADALLDQIARGMAKKPFNKLSPTHQDIVRSIAERMNGAKPD